ncbi:hypothetical protein FGE12_09085 [Aggregicoccus sp. 17bor-14]|nr:hypothetical protein [Aggregicoccus sp. 17bor-14]
MARPRRWVTPAAGQAWGTGSDAQRTPLRPRAPHGPAERLWQHRQRAPARGHRARPAHPERPHARRRRGGGRAGDLHRGGAGRPLGARGRARR